MACQLINDCTYFLFDKEEMVCKLHKEAASTRVCDLIHGTAQPNLQACIDEGALQWTLGGECYGLNKSSLGINSSIKNVKYVIEV